MSRLPKSERLAAKGRPKRRAAKTHFFKYQLATNPSRAEENDLKRALEESLNDQNQSKSSNRSNSSKGLIVNSANSSDVSRSNNSSRSDESSNISVARSSSKRTRFNNNVTPPVGKRAKLDAANGSKQKCDGISSVSSPILSSPSPSNITRAIRTYSRSQANETPTIEQSINGLGSSTPISNHLDCVDSCNPIQNGAISTEESSQSVSKSTQTRTPKLKLKPKSGLCSTVVEKTSTSDQSAQLQSCSSGNKNDETQTSEKSKPAPVQHQYLKFKRESKNYAYAKMTAMSITSKSPSSNSRSSSSKKSSPNGVLNNNTNKDSLKVSPKTAGTTNGLKHDNKSNTRQLGNGKKSPINNSSKSSPKIGKNVNGKIRTAKSSKNSSQVSTANFESNDCSSNDTSDLSNKKNQNQIVLKRRSPQGSWALLGAPEERVIYLRDDEPPRRMICYPAIKHTEGDVIQVKDSVLLRSSGKITDPPFIAKVCSFWEDAETGHVMMTLFWYYKPEHTEEGRKQHHLSDEIFASRHRDVDSVECIDDKCYVLTFNEYCRYRKRCKMEQVNAAWSLTDVTIPLMNESYPRRNRIPDSDVNPEKVFCCRQVYDSRHKRLVKNAMINGKYGNF